MKGVSFRVRLSDRGVAHYIFRSSISNTFKNHLNVGSSGRKIPEETCIKEKTISIKEREINLSQVHFVKHANLLCLCFPFLEK